MRKFDFIRVFFLVISLLIILLGISMKEGNGSVSIIGGLIVIALVVLDRNLPRVTKLSKENPKVKTMEKINRVSIGIIVLLTIYLTLSPTGLESNSKNVILIGLISIFMIGFGNIAPKIPFNRYIGLRLPWTIRDEETWRIAHKIVGYTAFPIAILMFISSFYFDANKVGATGVLLWVLIPGLYSMCFYYKKMSFFKN